MSAAEPCLWAVRVAGDDVPVLIDGVGAAEPAELLAFTADVLGWRGADVIRVDLAAHLSGAGRASSTPRPDCPIQTDQHSVVTPFVDPPSGGVRDSS
ncbi:MAG TPA: hypothetical protein VHS52_08795 [Acidimicrobiales bacterium]|jgi:hypothetical protein|nr:hypothetical protein [Acidimicrobiales bacterium]